MARYIVQMRRGTAAQWKEKSTLIPQEGEIVIELDEENNLHKLKIGDGVHTYAELAYLQAGDEIVTQVLAKAMPRVVTIELASTWTKDADEKYSQVLTLDGITENSRLDLQPTADMLAEFKKLGLVFVTENNGGTITVYSVGNMPLKAYTMQATIVETECDGGDVPVVGVPVGTPVAQTDWDQNDETKADYVKNRTHWIDFTNEIQPAIEVTPFFNTQLEIPMGVLGDFNFTVGKKYKVVFDGKEYICEAIMATMEGLSAPAIGKTIVNGGADTGEPFAMFRIADESTAYSIFFDMNPHTIQIFEEVPHKIPTKFVPTLEEMRVEEVVIIPETTIEDSGNAEFLVSESAIPVVANEEYSVNFNGTEYTLKCVDMSDMAGGAPAKLFLLGSSEFPVPDGEPPFGIIVMENIPDLGAMTLAMAGSEYKGTSITIGIKHKKPVKIPTKFIPTLEEMRSKCVEIVPLTEFTPSYDSSIDAPMAMLNDFELVSGNKYKVIYDGAEYICEAFSGTLGTLAFTAIGNKILVGGEDTGDPFGIGKVAGANAGFVISMDMDSHSVQVEHEIIHKIPSEFIDAEWMATKNVVTKEIIPPSTIQFKNGESTAIVKIGGEPLLEAGANYLVTWQGIEYECTAKYINNSDLSGIYISNSDIENDTANIKFGILDSYSSNYQFTVALKPEFIIAESCSIRVQKIIASTPNKLPMEYLPDEALNKPLIGTTAEITPTQVKEAIMAGRPVLIGHLDNTFGLLSCNYFTISESLDTLSTSAVVKMPDNSWYAVEVVGHTSNNTWVLLSTATAEKTDIPNNLSDLTDDATHRTVTDTEKSTWNAKATTNYVDEKVAGIVDSSPEALNTLNELAAALGDDPNFATTVMTEIGKKADKSDVPTALKNPNALTFIGGVTEIYDGSSEKTVNIIGKAGTGTNAEIFNDAKTASGTYSHAEGRNTIASGDYGSHAEGDMSIASGDAGAHAEGKETRAIGNYSHAEGCLVIAGGNGAHAEGINDSSTSYVISGAANATTYTGRVSNRTVGEIVIYNDVAAIITAVDETAGTITLNKTLSNSALSNVDVTIKVGASGQGSHIEGVNTFANGHASHAEGRQSKATGATAHAEGRDTIASGDDSHAEGYNTTAGGAQSHAEGNNTIVSYRAQHVQGEYNIRDLRSGDSGRGTYAHIVGNGTAYNARSNAHTLDWDGNAWFQGDVYVGSTSGTNKDNGSKKLIAAPTNVVAGDLLMYDGTNWTKISKADLIAEIIAALPNAEEASF